MASYYGLRRRSAQQHMGLVPNYLRNDVSEMGALAYLGKLVAVADTFYCRTRGSNASLEELAEKVGLSRFHGRHPTLTFAYFGFADIGWRLRAYETLSRPARIGLGLAAMTLWLVDRLLARRLQPFGRRAVRILSSHRRRIARRVRRLRRRARSRALRGPRRVARLGRRVLPLLVDAAGTYRGGDPGAGTGRGVERGRGRAS